METANAKVWERLDQEDQRFVRLETSVHKLDAKLDEKMEMVQEWLWVSDLPEVEIEANEPNIVHAEPDLIEQPPPDEQDKLCVHQRFTLR